MQNLVPAFARVGHGHAADVGLLLPPPLPNIFPCNLGPSQQLVRAQRSASVSFACPV